VVELADAMDQKVQAKHTKIERVSFPLIHAMNALHLEVGLKQGFFNLPLLIPGKLQTDAARGECVFFSYSCSIFFLTHSRPLVSVVVKIPLKSPSAGVGGGIMTGKEIVRLAFELKPVPRIPVTLVAGAAWAVHRAGKTLAQIKNDPDQIADVFIRYYRQCRQDLLWTGSNFLNYPIHFLGCALKDDSSDSPALEGSAIKSLDELDQLRIEKVVQHPTMQAILRSYQRIADAIGKETLIMPTNWAPFTFAARILGVENTMMATISEPDRLNRLIRFATDLIWALVEQVLVHEDIPGVIFSDPVASGDLISPPTFRDFSAPALKDLVARTRARGKYAMIHICGNTSKILEDVLEIGPHCFSLENKVPLKTAKEILGGKVCVAGNVSPTGAFLNGKPEEVLAEARACLETWGNDPGYILTVGCDFAKNVPLENIMALMSLKSEG